MSLSRRGKSAVALVQLAAILFLAIAGMLHLAFGKDGRTHASAFCSGDHEACGCAPELIAAKTCCCYQHAKIAVKVHPAGQEALSCCASGEEEPEAGNRSPDRDSETVCSITVPSCGGAVKALPFFGLKLDCLLASLPTLPPPLAGRPPQLVEPRKFVEPEVEPEVPPPILS